MSSVHPRQGFATPRRSRQFFLDRRAMHMTASRQAAVRWRQDDGVTLIRLRDAWEIATSSTPIKLLRGTVGTASRRLGDRGGSQRVARQKYAATPLGRSTLIQLRDAFKIATAGPSWRHGFATPRRSRRTLTPDYDRASRSLKERDGYTKGFATPRSSRQPGR
jgi:hypothetical protein